MSTLDQFKEEWKKQPSENFSINTKTQTAMLELLNSRTKDNVRKNTGGLLGITIATCTMLQLVNTAQSKMDNAWVDAVCWIAVPSMVVLCVTCAVLYFRLNKNKLSKMNTAEYLTYLIAQLQRTESLFKNIVMPLLPVMIVPLMLHLMNLANVGPEQVQWIVVIYFIFFAMWLVFGFFFFFKWVMSKHDYHTLRKQVELSYSEL